MMLSFNFSKQKTPTKDVGVVRSTGVEPAAFRVGV